jgi:hypothetical protein
MVSPKNVLFRLHPVYLQHVLEFSLRSIAKLPPKVKKKGGMFPCRPLHPDYG